ncbi:M48 family metalloprotease [Halorubrum sp. F4]|uniref:M48 family metalloprotease n=1 Tax=Halorubrum sp. F4 TaxID=2989715 RepID=UPI00247FC7CE|nr:M48 family metalloprotease [Halorubrum sp. F4]
MPSALPDDPSLRRRVLVATALVAVLPFAFIYTFVFVTNAILIPLLESQGSGPYHGRVYVDPLFAVVVVAGGLALQAWKGPDVVLGSVGARRVAADEYPDLHARVTRLAQAADVDPPDVAVAHNDAPNAMAVQGSRGAAVVVTTGLLETLDERELEGVLAHEVSHVANDDATVMTVAWLLPTVTYYLAVATAYVLYGMVRAFGRGSGSRNRGDGAAKALLVLVVTALVTLAVSATFWAASVLVHRVLSRYREYAADRGAAAITGDPTALASALRTLDEGMESVPDRDLRSLDGGAEALYVAPLEGRAFTDAELVSTDVFPATHPPTTARIDRLRAMAGELE